MNTAVLLVFPSLEPNKEHHHLPVGILSIAAPLDEYGIEYEVFDQRVEPDENFIKKLAGKTIVAVSMFTGHQTYCGRQLLKRAKAFNKDVITIVGGPHINALPAQAIESELIDYAVSGYADSAFCMLLNALGRMGAVSSGALPGVFSKVDDKSYLVDAKTSKLHKRFYNLPYQKLDLQNYINPQTRRVMYVTQYGCPGKCTFCATEHTRRFVKKPIDIVRSDLDYLYEQVKFQEVCFFDATLFVNKSRVMDILSYLRERPGLKWLADARAVDLIKYTRDELKAINSDTNPLLTMVVGLESGSQRVAEQIMKKGLGHLETFYQTVKLGKEVGINIASGLIFGVPGETEEDLKQTIAYIDKIRKVNPAFRISSTFFRPLPGTELFRQLELDGYLNCHSFDDWAEVGQSSHYIYNAWMDIPWMDEREKKKYRQRYDQFLDRHGDILV